MVAVRPEPGGRARAADADARAGAAGGRPGRPTSAGPRRSSASGRSPRTSCRTRSSWPAARSSWSPSAAANERRRATEARGRRRDRDRQPRRARRRHDGGAEAEATRVVGAAPTAMPRRRGSTAYAGPGPGRAARAGRCKELAGKLPRIEHLNLDAGPGDRRSLAQAGGRARRQASCMTLAPRVVVVHRRTELDELLARHGTRGQAAFFLASRGRDVEPVEARDAARASALAEVSAAIPVDWRRGLVERARPGPVPVRPGRHRGGRRAGRAGGERGEVPGRAARDRRRHRARREPGRAGAVTRRRRSPPCSPQPSPARRGSRPGRWSRR